MYGNVWEWTLDWYGDYGNQEVEDPMGPTSGNKRVLRGGDFWSLASNCRSASRGASDPSYGGNSVGFRLVRERR